MLFGPKYEELLAKSLSSKNRWKVLFGSKKIQDHLRREKQGSTFEKSSYLELEKIGIEELSQLLVKPYNNNTLQENRKGVRMNLSITLSRYIFI